MKKAKQSKEFLDALRKVPVVQVACDKVGLSRNTVYRWKREDNDFAQQFDIAMSEGVEYVNDMSESQLFQLIKDRKFPAVRYWLSHHHKRFKKHSPREPEAKSPEEQKEESEKMLQEINEMHDKWFVKCICSDDSDSEERNEDGQKYDS